MEGKKREKTKHNHSRFNTQDSLKTKFIISVLYLFVVHVIGKSSSMAQGKVLGLEVQTPVRRYSRIFALWGGGL